MDKVELYKKLTTNKDKKVTLMFTDRLWEAFKGQCEKEQTKPTPMLEILIIKYLESKNVF